MLVDSGRTAVQTVDLPQISDFALWLRDEVYYSKRGRASARHQRVESLVLASKYFALCCQ
jgi:uncharacterized protein YpmB